MGSVQRRAAVGGRAVLVVVEAGLRVGRAGRRDRHRGDALPRRRAAGDGRAVRARCGRAGRCCRRRARRRPGRRRCPRRRCARNCTSGLALGRDRRPGCRPAAALQLTPPSDGGAVLVAGQAGAAGVGRAGRGDGHLTAAACQVSEPPRDGRARWAGCGRCRTVPPGLGAAGAQAEVLPAWSGAGNCTSVSPSAVTVSDAPGLPARPGRAAVGRRPVRVGGDAGAADVGGAAAGDRDRRRRSARRSRRRSRPARSARCGRCARVFAATAVAGAHDD